MTMNLVLNDDRFDAFFLSAISEAGLTVDAEFGASGDHINAWGVQTKPCLVEIEGDEVVFIATTYDQVANYRKALKAHKKAMAEQREAAAAEQERAEAERAVQVAGMTDKERIVGLEAAIAELLGKR